VGRIYEGVARGAGPTLSLGNWLGPCRATLRDCGGDGEFG